ncbi:hypothetical protein HS048_35195 [Planomonospora sp. ID91781]|nr:hypothetical protein [Planomonospora sp. ID91781]
MDLAEVFRDTGITPAPGEELLRKGGANLWRGKEAVGGRLWLTGDWLVFRSHAVNVQRGVWAWPVGEIASTAPVNTLFIVPNGLLVIMNGGERVRFVVTRRRAWMADIARARG